jgi:hypothetical protein
LGFSLSEHCEWGTMPAFDWFSDFIWTHVVRWTDNIVEF